MGLADEYERARDWVANSLSFDIDVEFNAFEVRHSVIGLPFLVRPSLCTQAVALRIAIARAHLMTTDPEGGLAQITIRLLGGLLAAHALGPEEDQQMYLDHAIDLADRLLVAYEVRLPSSSFARCPQR